MRRGAAGLAVLTPGVLLGESTAVAKSSRRAYYYLDPVYAAAAACTGPRSARSRGCEACKACRAHAANKMFATARAANQERAHKDCNCRIRRRLIDNETYIELFGRPGRLRRTSVDRRHRRTRTILRRAAARARRRRRR